MKKLFLSFMLGLGASLTLLAVPAKPGLRTITQPDGTTITLRLVGDEHFHTFATTDGLSVTRDANGIFNYTDPATGAPSGIAAHNPGARTEAEASFLKTNARNLSIKHLADKSLERRKAAAKARAAKAPAKAASQVPNTGSARVPILLVQYQDIKFRDGANAAATFKDFFETGEKSARQYFIDQSNGKYTPQFDVYGPITLANNRVTYGGNYYGGSDKGVGRMVGEACLDLDKTINFKNYDNDGDGECDVVIVLYAGVGEASAYDAEDAVWPQQWDLGSSDYGKSLTLDGVRVNKFAVFNELYGEDESRIDGVGTFCHEFSHCLGLPDFYDTNYNGHFGMACWSLMDQGSYNDDGYTPIGYSAYEKDFMGWIKIPEATENTLYNLTVLNQKNEATDMAVKITNDRDRNEYYIIENRAQQGWDAFIPTEGMLISHVTYSASAWNNNTVNDYDLQRMTPIPADNSLKVNKEIYWGDPQYFVDEDDLLGDLWPYGAATELTDNSSPAAKVNTGSYMGKPVTDMTLNPDGTASFWFMKAPYPTMTAPVLKAASGITTTGFTAAWDHTAEADGTTYTLEVTTHRDITYEKVMEADFTGKQNPWTAGGYYQANDEGIKLGSTSNTGSVESPVFTTGNDGLVTVSVTARNWNADGSGVKISIRNTNGRTLDTKTVSLPSTYDTYTVVLQGAANAQAKVLLETIGVKKRMFISNVIVYNGDATSAAKAPAKTPVENGDATARTITGITSLSHTVSNLTEKGVFDFRVKAVPAQGAEWFESPWSEKLTVNLNDLGSIDSVATGNAGNDRAEYFTLEGIRVSADSLTPGIYICRRGTSVSKILVK